MRILPLVLLVSMTYATHVKELLDSSNEIHNELWKLLPKIISVTSLSEGIIYLWLFKRVNIVIPFLSQY